MWESIQVGLNIVVVFHFVFHLLQGCYGVRPLLIQLTKSLTVDRAVEVLHCYTIQSTGVLVS